MVFSHLTFVCLFLPAVLACYFIAPQRARNVVLVVASAVFYGWGGPIALVLIGLSIAANFALGRALDAAGPDQRYRLICRGVAGNLLILIVFKYSNFIIENINELLYLFSTWQLPNPPIPLPLGISFFTFHIISYLVDVYRGTSRAQHSPAAFALYIINFPQLIAGPIIRYHAIADQLGRRSVAFADLDIGVARFVAGLAKKLLIANPIGAVADQLFSTSPADLPIWAVWLAALCYGLQIYYDFSGYSDMAIGLARMFGFRFPENFNYPYAATSVQDFWRRWHITLSTWFRDYLYFPLGGSRRGTWITIRNLWVVFLLCGAWHGASWTFIIWGVWYGLFLSIEHLGTVHRVLAACPTVVRNIYAMLVVLVGWVFFRSPTLESALDMLARMFGLKASSEVLLPMSSHLPVPVLVLIVVAVCFSFPIWPSLKATVDMVVAKRPGRGVAYDLVRAAVIAVITVLSLATMTVDQHNPFIYFRF